MSGSNREGSTVVYGMLGIPSAANVPGSRMYPAAWIDHSNHLWLFGGSYLDAGQNWHGFDDLWMFDPSTNQWSWMGGSSSDPGSQYGWPGVYGVLGTPGLETIPGSRDAVANWSDTAGNFWLFGGLGVAQFGPYDLTNSKLNDLWEYQPGAAPARLTPTMTVAPSAPSIDASQDLAVSIIVNGEPGSPTPTGSVRVDCRHLRPLEIYGSHGGRSQHHYPVGIFQSRRRYDVGRLLKAMHITTGANGTANITVVSAATFKLACSPLAVTITRGASAGNTAVVTVSPSGRDTLAVLRWTPSLRPQQGIQRLPSIAIVGSPVNITGSNAGTATLVISTTAPTAAALHYPEGRKSPGYAAGGATLACILLFGLSKRRQKDGGPFWGQLRSLSR